MPTNHRLNMGMLGMHGSYAVNKKEQEADVLIAIGMRFSDRVTGDLSRYAKQAKVIHLDIDPSEIDKNVKTTVALIGDCKTTLPALTAYVNKAEHTEWQESFKPLIQQETDNVIIPATQPASGQLLMGEVVNNVTLATNNEAILVPRNMLTKSTNMAASCPTLSVFLKKNSARQPRALCAKSTSTLTAVSQ